MNEGARGEGNIETGAIQKPEIWIIDDDKSITGAQGLMIKILKPEYETRIFERGEDAINALEEQAGRVMPVLFLVDGNLDKDEKPEYRSGAGVVAKIREISASHPGPRVLIVGVSNMDSRNEEMRVAGADSFVMKADWQNALKILEKNSVS